MDFIPREFRNIETSDTVNFEIVINSSNISVILGEPASGKTEQLKNYENRSKSSYFIELQKLYEDKKEIAVLRINCVKSN